MATNDGDGRRDCYRARMNVGPDSDRYWVPGRAAGGDPGLDTARTRVAVLLDALPRIDLQVLVVAMPDGTRRAARARAIDAAVAAGRGGLLDEATGAVREAVLEIFSRSGFSGTWALSEMAVSVTRAKDRVAAAAAFEEAAMSAVVEDIVDEETTDILRSTTAGLFDMTGMPVPGSLSSFATPKVGSTRGPIEVVVTVGFVVICVVIAAAFSLGIGLLALAAGLAIVAGLTRQRRSSGS